MYASTGGYSFFIFNIQGQKERKERKYYGCMYCATV